jgi:transposase
MQLSRVAGQAGQSLKQGGRVMTNHSEAFVAFDTSKLRNAVADAGRSGEVRFVGEIENSGTATAKLVRKLAARYERLTFCYEAGPTGYGHSRSVSNLSDATGC